MVVAAATAVFPAGSAGAAPAADPVPAPLSSYVDNDGISGGSARDGDFDGSGYTFPAEELPPAGPVTIAGVPYEFPGGAAGSANNVVARGQTIALPRGRYSAAYLLAASSYGDTGGAVTARYADGTTSTAAVTVPDWYSGGAGALSLPFRYRPDGARDPHPVYLYAVRAALDGSRDMTGLTLPTTAAPAPGQPSMHVFALSVQPAVAGWAYSGRDAVDMGPRQDLVRGLFDASRQYTPELRPGLYYSLPEWYHPAYPPLGPFPGGPPRNPYTGAELPYTGDLGVTDYVRDLQVPQLREIVREYRPDILWCDIGGHNDSRQVLAEYLNQARDRRTDVTYDDRCGVSTHDFTTPEYTTYPTTVVEKWESSRGLDRTRTGTTRPRRTTPT